MAPEALVIDTSFHWPPLKGQLFYWITNRVFLNLL
jgi:hypothetical protein